jgi:cytochrome c biogenesis protein
MNTQVKVIGNASKVHKAPSRSDLDSVLRSLSSVKFGIGVMIVLAATTILGTLILQAPMAEPGQIEQLYAPQIRQVFDLVGLFDVFHSGWFITLLALLCLNITFASIDRFPGTWQYLRHPQTELDQSSIEAMELHSIQTQNLEPQQLEANVLERFRNLGFRVHRSANESRMMIFGEKGKYSRLSVYVVHTSLLLIFLGAMIDSIFGFRAYLSLPEGESSDRVELRAKNATTVQLPFHIRCDAAGVEHYADGTPKKWWSDLVILQNGQPVSRKHILVNDPMDFGGIRVFQSSFGSSGNPREFALTMTPKDSANAVSSPVVIRVGEAVQPTGLNIAVRVLEFIPDFAMHGSEIHSNSNEPNNPALLLELTAVDGTQWKTWAFQKMPNFHGAPNLPYDIRFESVRMNHFTGLQITKQPGQNVIWAGCFLMVAGLIVSFYFSHQRVWALIRTNDKSQSVLWLGGSSSKNKLDFERRFRGLEKNLGCS